MKMGDCTNHHTTMPKHKKEKKRKRQRTENRAEMRKRTKKEKKEKKRTKEKEKKEKSMREIERVRAQVNRILKRMRNKITSLRVIKSKFLKEFQLKKWN